MKTYTLKLRTGEIETVIQSNFLRAAVEIKQKHGPRAARTLDILSVTK